MKVVSLKIDNSIFDETESIIKASEKGKVKIKKIEDNTSAEVEILVYLPSGASRTAELASASRRKYFEDLCGEIVKRRVRKGRTKSN